MGKQSTGHIAFVGPMPPPVTGFRLVNALILERLRPLARVTLYDRAPRGGPVWTLIRQAALALRFCAGAPFRARARLYLALSGGRGQIIDLLYLAASRLLRQSVFVHHHSFAYINRPTRLSRLVFALTRCQTHILLSHGMAAALAQRYGLSGARTIVISNAAYFDDDPAAAAASAAGGAGPLRLGYLSNITFDKGFEEFFAVLARLRTLGVSYSARIGGPVAPDAQGRFEQLLAATPDVVHAGPLYGEAKDRFFRELDVFLFPTRYANEADPLVIHEALRCAVPVLACDRGAIAEVLRNGAGEVYAQDAFVESAAAALQALAADRASLAARRALALAQAQRLRAEGRAGLESFLGEIAGCGRP